MKILPPYMIEQIKKENERLRQIDEASRSLYIYDEEIEPRENEKEETEHEFVIQF